MIEGQNAYAERLCFGYIKSHVIHEILVKTRLIKLWVNELRTKHAWSNCVRCISFILLGLEVPLAAGNVWHTYLNIVTVLHVLRVMYMHTVRTVHNIFKKEFLLQYLFSLCDKLLSKGRGVGKSTKPLINHIKFPAGSKQWQFSSEKNCHIHCTRKHKNCCKNFV